MSDIVKMPIEDVLDLHTFQPREIKALLEDYFDECRRVGIYSVRLIHGKGRGILKQNVHSQLKKSPVVASFEDAPMEAGGWGATIVRLNRR